MRVLLVAPEAPDLPHATAEVQEIVNELRPDRVLIGNVRAADLLRELRRPFDLFWFAGHGVPGGIVLSDGVLSAGRLTQYLRRYSPPVFLNSCDTDDVAIAIHDSTQAPVIFSETTLDDERAMEMGVMLARAIADGLSITEAYQISREPGYMAYRMIGQESEPKDRLDDIMGMILQTAERLEQRMDQLDGRVDGLEADLRRQFDDLLGMMTPPLERALNWLAGYLIFVMIIPISFVDVRQMLDLTWRSGLGVAFLLAILSAVFFIRGMGYQFRK